MAMREIKFRGYNGEKWLFGNLDIDYKAKHACISDNRFWRHPVRFDTVGQFTGLKDITGADIYEGDILSNGRDSVVVSYKDEWGAYVGLYHGLKDLTFLLDECVNEPLDELKMKIVGNVYDNPEMLEGKYARD